jgi:hypothetical protein
VGSLGCGSKEFSANFYWTMNGINPCQQMWCSACYILSKEVRFPMKERAIDMEENKNNPKERQRLIAAWGKWHRPGNQYKNGQDGDHARLPFEPYRARAKAN